MKGKPPAGCGAEPKGARVAAITGATGFIGQELVRSLLAEGFAVRALTRRAPAEISANTPLSPALTWIKGDLSQAEALAMLVSGAEVVIHLAGAVKARRQGDFQAINALGVAAVLKAAGGLERAPHFILVSSLAAREPGLSDYAASKAAGEEILRQNGRALPWTIIRPPVVYGPGDFEILKFFKSLKYGVAFLVGSPQSRVSLIHVRDLCAGIIATIGRQKAYGLLLHIDDGRKFGYTLLEIIEVGSRALCKHPSYWRLPRPLLVATAALNQMFCSLTGRAPMLTLGKVRELYHADWVSGGNNIAGVTDWKPRIDAETGLKETIAWYQELGFL